jgi:hypothetical protein
LRAGEHAELVVDFFEELVGGAAVAAAGGFEGAGHLVRLRCEVVAG